MFSHEEHKFFFEVAGTYIVLTAKH